MDEINIILQLNSLFGLPNSQHPPNIVAHSEEFANLLGNLLNALASGEKSILEASNAIPQTLSSGLIGFASETWKEEDQVISEGFEVGDSNENKSTVEEALSAIRLILLGSGIPLMPNSPAESTDPVVSMEEGSEKAGEDSRNLENGLSTQAIGSDEVREVATYGSSTDKELTGFGQKPMISGEPEPEMVLLTTKKGGNNKESIISQTNEIRSNFTSHLSNSMENNQHILQSVDHQLGSRLPLPLEFVAEYKNPVEVVFPKPRPDADGFALRSEFSRMEDSPIVLSKPTPSNPVTLVEVGNAIQPTEPQADDGSGITNNIPQVAQESLPKDGNSQLSGDEVIKDQGIVVSDSDSGRDKPSREQIHLESM